VLAKLRPDQATDDATTDHVITQPGETGFGLFVYLFGTI
jgi:hypothetical protein